MEAGFNHKNTDNMEKDQIIYDKRKAMGESIRAMRTAHNGKAWHQVRAPEWATMLSSNDTNDTNWNRLVSFESFDDNKKKKQQIMNNP